VTSIPRLGRIAPPLRVAPSGVEPEAVFLPWPLKSRTTYTRWHVSRRRPTQQLLCDRLISELDSPSAFRSRYSSEMPGAKQSSRVTDSILATHSGQRVVVVPEYPAVMLQEPYVANLAATLATCLDEAIRRSGDRRSENIVETTQPSRAYLCARNSGFVPSRGLYGEGIVAWIGGLESALSVPSADTAVAT
jgi:hypothetical protein